MQILQKKLFIIVPPELFGFWQFIYSMGAFIFKENDSFPYSLNAWQVFRLVI